MHQNGTGDHFFVDTQIYEKRKDVASQAVSVHLIEEIWVKKRSVSIPMKRYGSEKRLFSFFARLYYHQENGQYRHGKGIWQDSSTTGWCLSALQALRATIRGKVMERQKRTEI